VLVWAAPVDAGRLYGNPVRHFITEAIAKCKARGARLEKAIDYPSDLLPNLPLVIWGSGYQGTLFARGSYGFYYGEPVFVRLRLKPDGSLADAPKIIEAAASSRTAIEREARTYAEQSWAEAIQRCAPFHILVALASHFEGRIPSCFYLTDGSVFDERGWNPCKAEWDLEP
jgi:hypothetical protein